MDRFDEWIDGWMKSLFIPFWISVQAQAFLYIAVYIHRKAYSSGKSYNQQMNRIDR